MTTKGVTSQSILCGIRYSGEVFAFVWCHHLSQSHHNQVQTGARSSSVSIMTVGQESAHEVISQQLNPEGASEDGDGGRFGLQVWQFPAISHPLSQHHPPLPEHPRW